MVVCSLVANIQTDLSRTSYRYNSQGEPIEISTTHHDTNQNNTATPNGKAKANSQSRTFTYGARGELLTISDNGKLTASYQYNHALQRISKTVVGQTQNHNQTTQYLWHGGLLDAESQLDSQGHSQITKRYFYINLRPVAVIEYADSPNQQEQANPSPQLYAIHTDHLGTPQALSNAQQQVVWQAEYASFGQATVTAMQLNQGAESSRIESNSASNAYGLISTAQANTQQPSVPPKHFEFNLRFAGQYADAESGYHYNWHRYYDPATGRYLTPDPIGLQGGLNGYGYVGQNPLQGVDPAGLADNATPYDVVGEFLRGEGKDHYFTDGDPFTEILREHNYIRDLARKACKGELNESGTATYSARGWNGPYLILVDANAWLTHGIIGNTAVAALGTYYLNYTYVNSILTLNIKNKMNPESMTRPPIFGNADWYINNVVPYIRDHSDYIRSLREANQYITMTFDIKKEKCGCPLY